MIPKAFLLLFKDLENVPLPRTARDLEPGSRELSLIGTQIRSDGGHCLPSRALLVNFPFLEEQLPVLEWIEEWVLLWLVEVLELLVLPSKADIVAILQL